jgi:hypothetical protein
VCRTITRRPPEPPKNHERRDVDLTADGVALLGAWCGELGRPEDKRLVLPGDTRSGYLVPTTILV